MESYRYRFTNRTDFKKFIGFLTESKISFSASHGYVAPPDEHVYHVAVTVEDDKAEKIFKIIGSFLDFATDLRKAEYVNELYKTPQEAYEDPFADPYTLHTMLGIMLGRNADLHASHIEECANFEKRVKTATDEKKYYQEQYYKSLSDNNRLTKQICAIGQLIDSILMKALPPSISQTKPQGARQSGNCRRRLRVGRKADNIGTIRALSTG